MGLLGLGGSRLLPLVWHTGPLSPPRREATEQTSEPVARLTCITAGLVVIDFEREEAGSGLAGQTGAESWPSGCSFGQLPCPQPRRGGGRCGERLAGGAARAGEFGRCLLLPRSWLRCRLIRSVELGEMSRVSSTPCGASGTWECCPALQAAHTSCSGWGQAGCRKSCCPSELFHTLHLLT